MKKLITGVWDRFCNRTGYEYLRAPLRYSRSEGEVTLDVPGYKQTASFSCGFVAGLIVLHSFFPRRSVTNFYYKINPDPKWGTQTTKLIKALRASGVGVSHRKGAGFETLKAAIDQGYPVITTVRRASGEEHWLVVYGFGLVPSRLFLAGNSIVGGHIVTWPNFRKVWNREREILVCWGAR